MKKTALVTGAAGGIGKAAALLLAQNNFNTILDYNTSQREAEALEARIRSWGCECFAFRADVSDMAQVKAMFEEADKRFGGVDVLVNNAGAAQQKLFQDITREDYDGIFDVNVRGVFNCCQRAVPAMVTRKSGKIINISSVWGVTGASCETHYSAAKAAVIGMTKALARELAPSGIQVNGIAPGVIDTPMTGSLGKDVLADLASEIPAGRLGSPDDVAELILFLASEKSDYITGQIIGVDGGFSLNW